MKSRLVNCAAAAIAIVGLAACSPASSNTSPSGGDGPVATACAEANSHLAKAGSELAKIGEALAKTDATDQKAMVDAVRAVGNQFGTLASVSKNASVQKSLTGLKDGYGKLTDLLQKAVVDKDPSAIGEMVTATTDIQKALADFQKLCAPA